MATTTHGPLPLPVPLARLVSSVRDAGSALLADTSPRYDGTNTSRVARVSASLVHAADRALTQIMRVVLSVVIDVDLTASGRPTRGRHYW